MAEFQFLYFFLLALSINQTTFSHLLQKWVIIFKLFVPIIIVIKTSNDSYFIIDFHILRLKVWVWNKEAIKQAAFEKKQQNK